RALSVATEHLAEIGGPKLLLLDPGDMYRARSYAPLVAEEIAVSQRRHAVETVDAVAALAEKHLPKGGVLIVAAQVVGNDTGPPAGFGPAIVWGPGAKGYLSSPSTHRTGLVTNLDVTATVLDMLGVVRPVQVVGSAMQWDNSTEPIGVRVEHLKRVNRTAVAVDSAKPVIVNTFIAMTTIVLLLSTVVLLRARRWGERAATRVVRAGRALLLLALAVPVASWLMFAVNPLPQSAAAATVLFVSCVAGIWFVTLLVESRVAMRVPVAALSLVAAAILLVDQWLGAQFSLTNFLGYSPLAGARYYGIGNEASALLLGAIIVGVSFLFDEWPTSRWTAIGRKWVLPLVGAVVVGTATAPFLGANIGMIVWGVVGFGLAWAQMNDHMIGVRTLLIGLAIVVVLIGAFSAYDLLGGAQQTHLGRAWASAERGGASQLWTIVARKAATNMR
ncbi:MAG: hypothetical protein Q8K89_05180, partial [Actinomycetota bacterium]|nr:hypothetical protein [Actinomycetota bacterium]